MRLLGYGKLNLVFSVVGSLPDGYHSVETVYQSVSLHDEITLEKQEKRITLSCSHSGLPTDEGNIAFRAAREFFKAANISTGVHIHIEKGIPFEAGLAGGSADAAAVLRGLNAMYRRPIGEENLLSIGRNLGADVPFCMLGGTRIGRGIGERLSPTVAFKSGYFCIVKPHFGNPTAEIFRRFDQNGKTASVDTDGMLAAIHDNDLKDVGSRLYNCFTPFSNNPEEIERIRSVLVSEGALGAVMTGTGSTVFGLFEKLPDMEQLKDRLGEMQLVNICTPMDRGVKIIEN